jgi:hypothetical protein
LADAVEKKFEGITGIKKPAFFAGSLKISCCIQMLGQNSSNIRLRELNISYDKWTLLSHQARFRLSEFAFWSPFSLHT